MKIACLLPFYNESSRINTSTFHQLFSAFPYIDFFLLNDGSTDNTQMCLDEFQNAHTHVRNISFPKNQGKAEVIRVAMLDFIDKDYEYIGFLDSDFATPLSEFDRLAKIAKSENLDLIFGSRVKLKGWDIHRNLIRHWASRMILTLVNTLFKLEIYDTQCGCKIFHKSILHTAFSKPFVTKWLFDIEVFIRCLQHSSDLKIKEIPLLSWKEIKGSKLKLKDFALVPYNIFKIYRKYN
jgi:dolichyl-phosphate beta-glucosyltransferase